MKKYNFHGFPVVKNVELIGYVTRDKLRMSIELLFCQEPAPSATRRCTFTSQQLAIQEDLEDLSDAVEEAVLQLRKEQPQELVVDMFQKLVSSRPHLQNLESKCCSHRTFDKFYSHMKES